MTNFISNPLRLLYQLIFDTADAPRSPELKKSRTELEPNAHHSRSYGESDRHSRGTVATVLRGRSGYPISREHVSASQSVDSSVSRRQKGYNHDGKSEVLPTSSSSVLTLRERTAISAAQKQTTDRLASLNKSEGGFSSAGSSKEFRSVMNPCCFGNMSLDALPKYQVSRWDH